MNKRSATVKYIIFTILTVQLLSAFVFWLIVTFDSIGASIFSNYLMQIIIYAASAGCILAFILFPVLFFSLFQRKDPVMTLPWYYTLIVIAEIVTIPLIFIFVIGGHGC
jgi:hypothetical protein